MKRFHLIFGLIVLVVFLLTGQYMDRFHEHLRYTPDGPGMLFAACGEWSEIWTGLTGFSR